MKIVVNTIPLLSPLTGIGKYIWKICDELRTLDQESEYTFYYGFYSNKLFFGNRTAKGIWFVRIKDVVKKLLVLGRFARKLNIVGASLCSKEYDLYFEPNYIPLKIRAKKIVTTIADFSAFEHPEWHHKERLEYFNGNFWDNIKRSDHIITISDFIRNEAINRYGFSPEKLTTVPLGFDDKTFQPFPEEKYLSVQQALGLPDKFILCVGSIEPRKNLLRLIQAYQQLPLPVRAEYKLVLTGFRGWKNKEIMSLIEELKDDIVYTGYVSEDDLAALYNLATLFVFPSLYEGFGLPLLEAMACGCPVVASSAASLPEVGGGAALYVDPLDPSDIALKIADILNNPDLQEELKCKGLERVKMFSWEKSARQHLEVFNNVIGHP